MKKIQLLFILCMTLVASRLAAQEVKGVVYAADRRPLQEVVVSTSGVASVQTDVNGAFRLAVPSGGAMVRFWCPGYFTKEVLVNGQQEINVTLIKDDTYKYNETAVLPYRIETNADVQGADNLNKKDFALGAMSIDRALQGELTGLQVINKSGMTGEGAYMALHGIQTLAAESAPLVVINGIPYMPDKSTSQLVGGYSRGIFQSLNVNDIQNITLLTGAEASLYGSLGSNGVILIETDGATSDDMNTKISYSGQFGYNWSSKRLPLMNTFEYKSYLSDVGMTYYDNMETFFTNFPFLTDPDNAFNYYYQYDTDWQDYLYQNGMTTDHLIRVEGGDAIAKYDISLGYLRDEGTIKNTYSDRYNAQINTNVLVSKKFEITTTLGLAYLNGSYQEQGMNEGSNPMLASYKRAPVLSPYKSDMYGDLLDSYSSYYFGANTNTDFMVSNPLAIVNTLSETTRQYDVNMKFQLAYKPTTEWAFNALVGLYYNYDQESAFIPGINNSDIIPIFDSYGESKNTVRQGVAETFNMFYNVNAAYHKVVGEVHTIEARLGGQVLTTKSEYDMGVGRNTANDFYQTLGDVNKLGRYFSGYTNKWNWLNAYLRAGYTYSDLFNVALNLSADGASSTGKDAQRMGFFPSVSGQLMLKNWGALKQMDALDKLNLWADYGLTGNSRFPGNYGRYYYVSQPYQYISGIIRTNVPNTKIKWEENKTLNVGLNASAWGNRVDLSAKYFQNNATNVLVSSNASSVYGTGVHYSNDAAIDTKGFDVALKLAPVFTRDFKWYLGGNITVMTNEVSSLGTATQLVNTLSDEATLLTKVGENPYSFYGYETKGVYESTKAALTAYNGTSSLKNRNGVAYEAGDVRFVDQNGDGFINDKDKVILGSATPDFYGSLFSRFQYKGFALDASFIYSVGNEAYNAVRRVTESASDFSNQSTAVLRRWTMDGQITDMPRANYGDQVDNNAFSDRWIEDASYLKLRDVTLSYTFTKPVWNFFQGGTIYVAGQNLFCITDYLGLDPECSYSYSSMMQGVDYAKAAMPKTVKIGVNLKF